MAPMGPASHRNTTEEERRVQQHFLHFTMLFVWWLFTGNASLLPPWLSALSQSGRSMGLMEPQNDQHAPGVHPARH
eukprot:12000399-Prorocentrum_lima.AAC.1